MKRLIDLTSEYLNYKKKSSNLSSGGYKLSLEELNEINYKYDDLGKKISNFLTKAESVLKQICSLYSEYNIEYSSKHIFINGKLPVKAVGFNQEDCFEKSEEFALQIGTIIKKAVNSDLDSDDIKALIVYHYSLKYMQSNIEHLKERYISLKEMDREMEYKSSQEKETEINNRLKKYEKQINEICNNLKEKGIEAVIKNQLFIGYEEVECSDEVKDYLIKNYGLSGEDFLRCPFTLGLGENDKNIAFFENTKCNGANEPFSNYLHNVYFKNATNFNGKMKVAHVKSSAGVSLSSNVLTEIKNGFVKNGSSQELPNVTILLDSKTAFEQLLDFRDNDLKDIVSHNENNPLSLKDYTLVFIDNFPACIDTVEKKNAFLELINDSKRMGFFFIINGELGNDVYDYEINHNQIKNDLMPKSFSAENCDVVIYDYKFGRSASFPKYDESILNDVKSMIFKHNRKLQTFLLKDKAKDLGDLLNPNKPYQKNDIGSGMSIPVGFTEKGTVYNFSTNAKSNPFAVITGNIGSGKTAFLHTLILTGALKYSPEELEYYIVDFKMKTGSADFDAYTYRKGVKNLYIPHIRYLSTKSSEESANDICNLIEKCASDNLMQITMAGYGNFESYNNSEEVKSGKLKKIPQKYFIIDEYGTMIGAKKIGPDSIASRISNILSRIRSSGVGIIFSGQRSDILDESTFNFISTNIAFDLGTAETNSLAKALNLTLGKTITYEEEKAGLKYIFARQGFGVFRSKNLVTRVHTIYSGDVGTEEILLAAECIRKRCMNEYNLKQVVPGSDSFEIASSYLREEIFNREKRINVNIEDNKIITRSMYDSKLKEILYLGVSKTTSIPLGIRYNTNGRNYLVYASDKKITKVLTNAYLQSLRESKNQNSKIWYVAMNLRQIELQDQLTEEIQKYKDDYLLNNIFDKKSEIIQDGADVLEKIMFLSKLCKDRKMAFKNKDKVDTKTIYYFFMDKIDWLFDEDYVSAFGEEEELVIEDSDPGYEISEDELLEMGYTVEDIENLKKAQNSDREEDIKATKYTVNEICEALNIILTEGTKYNVYAALGFNEAESLSLLCNMFSISEIQDYKQVILGSYEMIETQEVNEMKEPKNTCLLCEDNIVLRLYDFSHDDSDEYWDIFKKEYDE